LRTIIVEQIASENVGIKPNHAARFCDLVDAPFGAFHAPARSRRLFVLARITTVPSVSNVKFNSSDAFNPRASRMSFGIVV
jgi:hypothetical protein